MYKFLCALQHQGVAGGLMWDWGRWTARVFAPRHQWPTGVFAGAMAHVLPMTEGLAAAKGIELFRGSEVAR